MVKVYKYKQENPQNDNFRFRNDLITFSIIRRPAEETMQSKAISVPLTMAIE
jgi:hypothetical protein